MIIALRFLRDSDTHFHNRTQQQSRRFAGDLTNSVNIGPPTFTNSRHAWLKTTKSYRQNDNPMKSN